MRDAVKAWMARRLEAAFVAVDQGMTGPFLAGGAPGIAERYLLMVAGWWTTRFDFAVRAPDLAACLRAVSVRPFVIAAYEAQGQMTPCFNA